ncbi:xanthine dehydrogenase family protein molybdopterin-binding subunit [Cellvibrio fibrivorans]|uniref:Isoquinoline 1-oxidoreductase beta subunit n=1 Tax=Cellvibrio fibrivorans TaxID=126350 RepID=A0ABU1UZ16_9GAMM|nr:xanthine dehydrogenase family protein molybdopterin-binding subunit [Cellvibrio fibrivorans]MDR7090446.1 isoquinoline 1-oxidoreductase beta subunit [Cellvibrio fibrivorans]
MNFLKRQTIQAQQNSRSSALSRRTFLQAVSAGGGLLLGSGFLIGSASVAAADKSIAAASTTAADAPVFNAFLKITPDSKVTMVVKHLDMGQGVSTGLTSLVAEELDASWEQMQWEFAPADNHRYNNLFWGPTQGTGGSSSIANSWMQLREAGAAARAMLVAAAAAEWKVPAEEIRVSNGIISHGTRSSNFGAFAAKASLLPVPQKPAVKDPKDFQLIGKTIPRKDSNEKTSGKAIYTQDIQLPGMLTALVAYPPQVFGKVKKVNAAKAKASPGVVAVVEFPRGVAVVAENFWAAKKARELLKIEWDLSACETRSSDELFKACHDAASKTGISVKNAGDAIAALAKAKQVIEAKYELPYVTHAAIEPINCVVKVEKNSCELWFACQMPTIDQQQVAAATGIKPEHVKINTLYAGGSFGRRACPSDYVVDAANIAKQIPGRAVKMLWTREDEILNARYRPMAVHHIRGAVSSRGKVVAWQHHAVAQAILRGTPFEGFIQGEVDGTVAEGIEDMHYTIPNLQVQATEIPIKVSTLWWRSVGHSGNAFVVETFIDQLAKAANKDPVVFRRKLLADTPRALGVLNLAAEKSAWGNSLPEGVARGIAVHKSFGTWVAQVAEVRVKDDGSFKVERVVCAVDCGVAVNPDVIRAQMEGGIGMGLSAALGEAITLKKGVVEQSNFHNYPLLSIDAMPKVEVHIVPSAEMPSGVGEPGLPPIAGAVANALFAATGKPLTKLPLGNKV